MNQAEMAEARARLAATWKIAPNVRGLSPFDIERHLVDLRKALDALDRLSKLQRWDLNSSYEDMQECNDGGFVKVEDVLAAIVGG